jgi:hypothetical protein
MGDFLMPQSFPAIACVLIGGPTRRIAVDGREWTFEMHPYCGPAVLGKRGEILDVQPGPRSLFWLAVWAWKDQGERIDAEGRCVWDRPAPLKVKHLKGGHYFLVIDAAEATHELDEWTCTMREVR